jgi:hypothetical protein
MSVSVYRRTSGCMYRIGGSVMVIVTLDERSNLVIKLIMGMCMYLRLKFAGQFACVRLRMVRTRD